MSTRDKFEGPANIGEDIEYTRSDLVPKMDAMSDEDINNLFEEFHTYDSDQYPILDVMNAHDFARSIEAKIRGEK